MYHKGGLMAERWDEGLSDDAFVSEPDRQYLLQINKVRTAIASGLGFDEATASIGEQDESLRKTLADDALKIIIAEEHFSRDVSLEDLAQHLKLPLERVESAKSVMLDEIVGDAEMREYIRELDQKDPGRIDA
jgi:hypothetical protein